MDKITIDKMFDKHYRSEDGIFHWPIRIVQNSEVNFGHEMFFFHAEHLDHPLKGDISDKRLKHDDIIVPQEKLRDLLAHLKHDGEFRNFKYHIVEFKLHRKWEKEHKNEIEIVNDVN